MCFFFFFYISKRIGLGALWKEAQLYSYSLLSVCVLYQRTGEKEKQKKISS